MNKFDKVVNELQGMDFLTDVYGHASEKWRHVFIESNYYDLKDRKHDSIFLEISEEGNDDLVVVRLNGTKHNSIDETIIEEHTYKSVRWTVDRVITIFEKYGHETLSV